MAFGRNLARREKKWREWFVGARPAREGTEKRRE
jgi:hypothetical protein